MKHKLWVTGSSRGALLGFLLTAAACGTSPDDGSPMNSGNAGTGSGGAGTIGTAGTGNAEAGTAAGGAPVQECVPPDCVVTDAPSVVSRFPRLTHQQWENTVHDLFGVDAAGLRTTYSFGADLSSGKFPTNLQRLVVSSTHWNGYQRAAEGLAEQAVTDAAIFARIAPAADARQFIETFGAKVFRRPLAEAEITRYLQVFDQGAALIASGDAFKDGVRLLLEVFLQSPHFLYRVEDSNVAVGTAIPLNGFEIASRLSYLIWNTMPDDALFAAAKAGSLDSQDGLISEAQRLLADPRSNEFFKGFHTEHFFTEASIGLEKSATAFPAWTPELGTMMAQEANLFLSNIVSNDGGVREVLTSTRTFVNADLAAIYGVQGNFGAEFTEVDLDPTQRAGFLTSLGFLTHTGTVGARSEPIKRGVFAVESLFCREGLSPPVDPVSAMKINEAAATWDDTKTTRENIDMKTGAGTCGAGCHVAIVNPMGYGLENYDGVGRYRTEDTGAPVNATASYVVGDGTTLEFTNAIELSAQLAENHQVHACYSERLLEYAYGRAPTDADEPLVERMAEESVAPTGSIKALVLDLVQTPIFRSRSTSEF